MRREGALVGGRGVLQAVAHTRLDLRLGRRAVATLVGGGRRGPKPPLAQKTPIAELKSRQGGSGGPYIWRRRPLREVGPSFARQSTRLARSAVAVGDGHQSVVQSDQKVEEVVVPIVAGAIAAAIHGGAIVGFHLIEPGVQIGPFVGRDPWSAASILALNPRDRAEFRLKTCSLAAADAPIADCASQTLIELGLTLVQVRPATIVVAPIVLDPTREQVEPIVQVRTFGVREPASARAVLRLDAGDVLKFGPELSCLGVGQRAIANASVDAFIQDALTLIDVLAIVLDGQGGVIVVAIVLDPTREQVEPIVEVGAFGGCQPASARTILRFDAGDVLKLGAERSWAASALVRLRLLTPASIRASRSAWR